jgi:sterol desaturase/sphingolipid hydroxylase (fatty acid hydroxylase superfamily)
MAGAGNDPTSAAADAAVTPLFENAFAFLTTFPDPVLSIATLISAFLIGFVWIATRGGRSWRTARPWTMLKIIFSPRYVLHRSHTLDILFYIFNTKVAGLTIGWLILSGFYITNFVNDGLVAAFGMQSPAALSGTTVAVIGAITLYIAYEFAYWLDHFLAHRIPILWEFHKVHHQAEVLSPLTVFRVHPVDSIVFYNIMALVMGAANGVLYFAFGMEVGNATAFSHALILMFFSFLIVHLQHSHVWIPFTGILGRLFISPAHHQIHHSTNPAHFDKNMGSCLAIFDWMFGTLYMPAKEREKLTFGVEPQVSEPHTLTHGMLAPFARGAGHVRAWVGASEPGTPVAQPEAATATPAAQ